MILEKEASANNEEEIQWRVEGAKWTQDIKAPHCSDPSEIATKAIEVFFKNEINTESFFKIGIVLMVSNTKMQSADEIYICHSPTIIANAGFYKEADELQKLIDTAINSD